MKIFGYNVEECLTFFMLIVIGYFIAKMFSQKCNGFSVGAQIDCESITNPAKCHMHYRHGCEFKDDKCGYKLQAPKSCDQCTSVKSLEKNKGNICVENKPSIVGMNCELDEQCTVGMPGGENYCKNGKCANEDRGNLDKNEKCFHPASCNSKLCIYRPNNDDYLRCGTCGELAQADCTFPSAFYGACMVQNGKCVDSTDLENGKKCVKDSNCSSGYCNEKKICADK